MAESGERMTFAELKKGMMARVVEITGMSDDIIRLQEMGLTVGTSFKVVKVAPFGDPVEIDLRGYRLCLRKHETRNFALEPVTAEAP
ncbi:MAG TPA: FeoA domain-containing protein [Fimbriimonadaceae bacterium]|nr:FeoA domain-containing protein [Fimbriimonadaceae bacterium]